MNNIYITNAAALIGRILMSYIFITGGYRKIFHFDATAANMDKMGVPGMLLSLVILTELGGGLLILFGYKIRILAFLMAGYTILTALLFHLAVGDAANMAHFYKNLAIAGGFLALMSGGAGAWSIDGWKKQHA